MKIITLRKGLVAALSLGALVLGIAVYAATSVTIADGTYASFEPFGGAPASTRMRTLTIAPGELLPWHYHSGIGAYTIISQGTLIVEDGCGGDTVYTQGQAFIEPRGRVHRGKNLTAENVITAQTFVVPVGASFSQNTSGQLCGRPVRVEECKGDGWRSFNYPRTFNNEAECITSVYHD